MLFYGCFSLYCLYHFVLLYLIAHAETSLHTYGGKLADSLA